MGSCVFYIRNSDFEKALEIKERVDKENAESEIKHVHPARKVIAYIGLALLVIYFIYKIVEKILLN